MQHEISVNGIPLPKPEGDIEIVSEKLITEFETEAGTTQVSVRRVSRLTISGKWTLTGTWIERFRAWAFMDTVTVSCYYPYKDVMSEHECQFTITSETHIADARNQLTCDGLYRIAVSMTEL
jgi:hypothetical protein